MSKSSDSGCTNIGCVGLILIVAVAMFFQRYNEEHGIGGADAPPVRVGIDPAQWEAVARVFEEQGMSVKRDGKTSRMRASMSVARAQSLSDYQLKVLAQAAYSRLGAGCILQIYDEVGVLLVEAWSMGVTVKR